MGTIAVLLISLLASKVACDIVLIYDNKNYTDGASFLITSDGLLTIHPDQSTLEVLEKSTVFQSPSDLKLDLGPRSGQFTLRVNASTNQTQESATFNVFYFKQKLTIKVERSTIYSDRLTCEQSEQSDAIKVTEWWWTKNSERVGKAGQSFEVETPGEYVCHAVMEIRIGTDLLKQNVASDSVFGDDAELPVGALIAIIVVGILILIASILLLIHCIKRKKRETTSKMISRKGDDSARKARDERRRQAAMMQKQMWMQQLQILQQFRLSGKTTKNAVLHGLLQDRKNTLNYVELKREAARLITLRPQARRGDERSLRSIREMWDRPDIVAYIKNIGDEKLEEKEMNQAGLIEVVPGCRTEKIPVRTDTQVELIHKKPNSGRLHMNRMKDYYDSTVIICQAPLPKQFADQWQAIWENSVGVVVWIGAFVEMKRPKMDSYVPMREGARVVCGDFYIQTMFTAKFVNEFDVYRVSVQFELDTRELIFLHVHMWPDHCVPDEPAQLADLVMQVQGHVFKQQEFGLGTLLIHCSVGVQRSPAFLAAYIGRQMWLDERRANVLGILRYIRRHRWRAFGYGDPFAQVQIVFGVMQVIATRQEMEGIANLAVAAEEERVFDRKARAAEEKLSDETTLKLG